MKTAIIACLLGMSVAHADVTTNKYPAHPPPNYNVHVREGKSDAEIVRESQRRAAERQRAEIAERLATSQKREEALRQQRQQDRDAQLQRYKAQQEASQERAREWREKFDADQKALVEKMGKNQSTAGGKNGKASPGKAASSQKAAAPKGNKMYGRAGEIVLNPATGKYERAASEEEPSPKKTTQPAAKSNAANTELHWNPVTKKYETVVREN